MTPPISLKSAMQAQKKYGGFDENRTWKCLVDLASVRVMEMELSISAYVVHELGA
jgi:hypothetical protein